VNIGITCYPTYGGSGIVALEPGIEPDRVRVGTMSTSLATRTRSGSIPGSSGFTITKWK